MNKFRAHKNQSVGMLRRPSFRKAVAKVRYFSQKNLLPAKKINRKQKKRSIYFVFCCFFRYFALEYGILTIKTNHTMKNSQKKHLGIGLVVLGAVLLILASIIPALGDLLDFNLYTAGSAFLVIAGIIVHIWMNKKLPLEDEPEDED